MTEEDQNDLEFAQLLRRLAEGRISEAEFLTQFWSFKDRAFATEAASEVFDYMIDDANMAEHVGLILDDYYRWRLRGSAQLIESRASSLDVRSFYRTGPPGT